ncbi:MAG: hypothetical protein B0D92_07185 [Spirochaeta sp. LUC14_002_19_P3]|nr:MAG: hypothetical protein B0D92_07185 [Spirochaeta sp. LUC14_002_19_P3]
MLKPSPPSLPPLDNFPHHAKNRAVLPMKLSTYRKAFLSWLAIAFTLAFTAATIGIVGKQKPQYWPGWFILRVPSSAEEDVVIAALLAQGVDDMLSASTAYVRYMDIPQINSIPAAQIDDVLAVGDPRRDKFLHNIGSLFQSKDAYLIYLPEHYGLSGIRRILKSSPVLNEVVLLDDQRWDFILFQLLFIPALTVFVFILPVNPLISFTAFLPWLFAVFTVGPSIILFSLALAVCAAYCGSGGRSAASLAGSSVLLVLAGIFLSRSELFCLGIAALVSGALFAILRRMYPPKATIPSHRYKLRVWRIREHQLFEPLYLLRKPQSEASHPLLISTVKIILAAAALIPFAIINYNSENIYPVPAAGEPAGGYNSLAALQQLFQDGGILPDAADIIASAVFQEGFMQGAQYGLPLPGTALKQYTYRRDGERIRPIETNLITYDEDWYKKTMETVFSDGIGRLYASLGGPSPIFRTAQPQYGASHLRAAVKIPVIIIAMLMIAAVPLIPGAGIQKRMT